MEEITIETTTAAASIRQTARGCHWWIGDWDPLPLTAKRSVWLIGRGFDAKVHRAQQRPRRELPMDVRARTKPGAPFRSELDDRHS